MNKKLYRSNKNKQIGGVCGGLAEYFNLDVVIMRIIMICLIFVNGAGFLLYILLWIMLPVGDDQQISAPLVNSDQDAENKDFATGSDPAQPSEQLKQPANMQQRSFLGGVLLIGLGGVFLLDEWYEFMDSSFFWPAILIVIGIGLIINSKKSITKEQ